MPATLLVVAIAAATARPASAAPSSTHVIVDNTSVNPVPITGDVAGAVVVSGDTAPGAEPVRVISTDDRPSDHPVAYFITVTQNGSSLAQGLVPTEFGGTIVLEHASGTVRCGDPDSVIMQMEIQDTYLAPTFMGTSFGLATFAYSTEISTYVTGGEQIVFRLQREAEHSDNFCQWTATLTGHVEY